MADTRDAITLTDGVWVNAYTASGITAGSAISIQNLSSNPVNLCIAASAPATSFKGQFIPPVLSEVAFVDASESGVWLMGNGPVSIQVS